MSGVTEHAEHEGGLLDKERRPLSKTGESKRHQPLGKKCRSYSLVRILLYIRLLNVLNLHSITVVKADNAIKSDQSWNAFKNGDKRAFEKIYRTYAKDLIAYGYKVIVDRRLIEDSVQDLFFELWQSRENLSHTTSIKFYLFRALRYKIIRNARANGMALVHSLDGIDIDRPDISHENHLIDAEVQADRSVHLKNLISQLPKRQQEAINLRFYHNFSNDQIAAIMEVNYQSACKLIYAALRTLKTNFAEFSNR